MGRCEGAPPLGERQDEGATPFGLVMNDRLNPFTRRGGVQDREGR